jgi:hypothetical protein
MCVSNANKRQIKYLNQDLPYVFTAMQTLEQNRLDNLKARLTKFSVIQIQTCEERKLLW